MWYPQPWLHSTAHSIHSRSNCRLNCLSYRLSQSISYCSQAVRPINTDQSMVKAIARVDCMVDQMIIATLITDSEYTQVSRDSADRILAHPIQYYSTFCTVQAFLSISNSSGYLTTGFQHVKLALQYSTCSILYYVEFHRSG